MPVVIGIGQPLVILFVYSPFSTKSMSKTKISILHEYPMVVLSIVFHIDSPYAALHDRSYVIQQSITVFETCD